MNRLGGIVVVWLALVAVSPPCVIAMQQPADQSQAAREGYVPVKDLPPAEQLPAAPLVIGAYAFIWLGVVGYLWTIWRRLGAVDGELVALRRAIERRQ